MWREFRRQVFGNSGDPAPRQQQEVVRSIRGKRISDDHFSKYTDQDLEEFDDMLKAYGDAIASANED